MLSTILAIVAVMFLLTSRVESLSTSSLIDEQDLNNAVDTIVAKISDKLVLDTPGVSSDPNEEYYDYPDSSNRWLASLEPYEDSNEYYWGQISDLTGYIFNSISGVKTSWDTQDINVDPPGSRKVIQEYPDITFDNEGHLEETLADADGDGIADSKWFELEDASGSKGQKFYAAVRIIDNGGMLNINTAYQPDETQKDRSDGAMLNQADLDAFARGTDDADDIFAARSGMVANPANIEAYELNGARKLEDPYRDYTLFDISDELELRHRFLIDSPAVTRIETVWKDTTEASEDSPYAGGTMGKLEEWQRRAVRSNDPNYYSEYDRRHLLTTYNIDRIIDPNGDEMININDANAAGLYSGIHKAIYDANDIFTDVNSVSAQLAANIVDCRDDDADVTVFNFNSIDYYGFEAQPFITEMYSIIDAANPDEPGKNSYSLELYNPFNIPVPLDDLSLSIDFGLINIAVIPLGGVIDANGYFVVSNNLIGYPDPDHISADLRFSGNYVDTSVPPDGTIDDWDNYTVTLKRTVGGAEILMDHQETEHDWFGLGVTNNIQRILGNSQYVYQWQYEKSKGTGTLGAFNATLPSDVNNYNLPVITGKFTTVGDFTRALIIGPDTTESIGQKLAAAVLESDIRLNLAESKIQRLFQYLTNWDPPAEADNIKVYGRVNINTAPWFVIAQLPWMEENIAKAIVNYRDSASVKGFKSIAELINVSEMHFYGNDYVDLDKFPDLTPNDGAIDDFEERDVIFARISNLVTVRSDVFTAYILVRLGKDGPQKRVVAILDRSDVDVYNPSGRVKVLAMHEVSYPK
jgi:hypothetical protein